MEERVGGPSSNGWGRQVFILLTKTGILRDNPRGRGEGGLLSLEVLNHNKDKTRVRLIANVENKMDNLV